MGYLKELIPGILAGIVGGMGAYTAVRVDIAILLTNQKTLIEQGKISTPQIAKNSQELSVLEYRADSLEDKVSALEGVIVRR